MKQRGFVQLTFLLALILIGAISYLIITRDFPYKQYLFGVFYFINSKADTNPVETVTLSLAANSDIVNEIDKKLETPKKNNTHWIGNANSTSGSYLGMRFTGQSLPNNIEIQSATLQLVSSQTGWEKLSLAIYAEKNISPVTFSASSVPSNRTLTTFYQPVSQENKWTINKTYSFDVTKPVKEVVSIGGNKGTLALIVQGRGKAWDYYSFYDNRLPSRSPKLVINYTKAQALTPTPTAIPSKVPTPTSTPKEAIWKPNMNTSWHWMIDHALDINNPKDMGLVDPQGNKLSTPEPEVYDIDGFYNGIDPNCNIKDKDGKCVQGENDVVKELHARGKKVICYIDVGVYESYRPDAYKFPQEVIGSSDIGWNDSYWLDVRKIDILGPIMLARMKMCKDKGYDAIEPDEIDSYENDKKFGLTYQDQINYNKYIAELAHSIGMSIGQKGDTEQVKDLWPYFDWTLNEECFQYKECDLLKPYSDHGKAVFQVEYKTNTSNFCSTANANNWNAMKMPLKLNGGRYPCR